MKRAGTIAVCLAGGLMLPASLHADDLALNGNPYAVVVARNVFGLNPPPPVDANPAPVEPPVKITPNGIMTILGQLQVLFKVAAKPGGKDASYILTEGQSQDDIEVTKIDEKAGVVTFNNHGIVQELPLVAATPSSTPAAAAPGSAPGIQPGAAQGGNTGANPFMNRFGNRGATIPPRGNNNPAANDGSNLRSIPTRGGASTEEPRLSPEEQAIMIVAQKAKFKQEGNPAAAIFPPTPLDDEAGVGQQPPTGGPGAPGGP